MLARSATADGAIRKDLLFAPTLDQIGCLCRWFETNDTIFNATSERHGEIFRPDRMSYHERNQNNRQKSLVMQHLLTPTNSLKLVESNS